MATLPFRVSLPSLDEPAHVLIPVVDVDAPILVAQLQEASREQRFQQHGGLAQRSVPRHHVSQHVGVYVIAEAAVERVIETPRPQRHEPPDDRVSVEPQESRQPQRLAVRDETLIHLYEGHRRLPRSTLFFDHVSDHFTRARERGRVNA